jgi:putative peptide zinc metalloprotease protein
MPEPSVTMPRLAAGTQLAGEYRDAGTVEAQYMLRRGDGRMVCVSPLLYLLAGNLDGHRDRNEIATRMTVDLARTITPDNVAYLIDEKLRPLGVIGGDAGHSPAKRGPVLALSARRAVAPRRLVGAVSSALRPLFLPAVVAAVLSAFVAMDVWLVLGPGLGAGVDDVLRRPALVLLIVGLTFVAGGFHELGHATAGRYGGAEPGAIGVGIYLVWPAFFNDLTDTYRLDRRGRLRADLGGVYFNVVFMLALAGVYALTASKWLLLLILLQHLAVLQQFLPFLRLDGYYVVSDWVGVPDLFAHIVPILAGLIPGRDPAPSVGTLRRRVRVVVTAWVFTTLVLLGAVIGLMGAQVPRMVATTAALAAAEVDVVSRLDGGGALVPALVVGLQLCALVLALGGLAFILLRVLRRAPRTPRALLWMLAAIISTVAVVATSADTGLEPRVGPALIAVALIGVHLLVLSSPRLASMRLHGALTRQAARQSSW